MVEVLDNKSFVYVTVDEKPLVDKLFRLKDAAAVYYKQGRKIAYHWILNPVTVANLNIEAE